MIAARMPSVEARPFLLPQTPVVVGKEKQWDGRAAGLLSQATPI